MRPLHKIIFAIIGLLALGTFLFGILQFMNLRDENPARRSNSQTDGPGSGPPAGR